MAELETSAGNFSLAARHADEATEVMVRSGLRQMASVSLYVRAHLEARQGKVAAARTHATRALEIATRAGSVPSIHDAAGVLGFLALSIGDHLAADRLLTPAITMMVSLGVGDPAALRSVPDEIEALVTLGELGRAEALLDPFEQQASFMGRRWAAAAASRCRALVCSGHGDLAAAVGAADRAVDGHRELPYPFELGRSLLVQGVVHRRRKEKAVAAEAFREAVEIFDRLGTPLWADKARAEIRRVGLRPRAPLELTATEARVAELAASGLTNREVADALFVSPKTVESNLAKVYRKLGIRSRAELGATIAARERVAAKSRSG
jgi:DNA-binding CsgD family transcriptional regulator